MGHAIQTSVPPRRSASAPDYEAFLAQLSVKGRAAAEKHDELCDAEHGAGYGARWKRLAADLGKLAGHATEMYGHSGVKFYIADGKYKLQVFALEDTRQGTIVVYLPDVLQLAIGRKILSAGTPVHHYKVRGGAGQVQLTPISSETEELTVCKAMVGWGRRALRAEFGAQTPEEHVHAIELMCELAAQKWLAPQAPTAS